jgi:hypothetical protein
LSRFARIGLLTLLFILVGAVAGPVFGQSPPARSQTGISIDSSPQLFAVLSALIAAGYDTSANDVFADPAYASLQKEMAALQGLEANALRKFYTDHQVADSSEMLSRYVSFALVVGPPPRFSYLLGHDQLPPDVLAIEGFQEVMANFYPGSGLDREWARFAPRYSRQIERLRSPMSQIVLVATSYLREVPKPSAGRTFAVIVEPLVGGHTNFRNFGDHYAVVVGTASDLPLDEIRHGFLHFLLDPLPIRYGSVLDPKRVLLDVAARAPRLPQAYREDFTAFFTECLVRAVELRLRRAKDAQLEAALTEADRSGYVLERPLVAQLEKFEKAEPAMQYYFPELAKGIDVAQEQQRLSAIQFAPATSPLEEAHARIVRPLTELDRWLARGERQLALQDAAGAASTFEQALAKYPNQPRAMYGLARASVLQKDAERARALFEKLVAAPAPPDAPAADQAILAWSHVYLGRIHDVEGERERAVKEYNAALAVDGAPEAAREAAQHGISTGYKHSASGSSAGPKKP